MYSLCEASRCSAGARLCHWEITAGRPKQSTAGTHLLLILLLYVCGLRVMHSKVKWSSDLNKSVCV